MNRTHDHGLASHSLPGLEAIRTPFVAGKHLVSVLDALALWMDRYRQRRALRALPDHLLSDIGLSRSDAEQEGGKPFWRG